MTTTQPPIALLDTIHDADGDEIPFDLVEPLLDLRQQLLDTEASLLYNSLVDQETNQLEAHYAVFRHHNDVIGLVIDQGPLGEWRTRLIPSTNLQPPTDEDAA